MCNNCMRVRVGRSETESWSSGRSVFVVTVRRTSLSLSLQYYDIKLLINNLINKPQPRHFCISTFVFISICRMDRLYPPIYWYFVYNIYIYIYTHIKVTFAFDVDIVELEIQCIGVEGEEWTGWWGFQTR